MALTPNPTGKLLGWGWQGDIGPVTYYTSARGKIVAFSKSPPLSPPTRTQVVFRNLFRAAGRSWRMLTEPQKQWWRDLAKKAGTRCVGFGLYLWFARSQDTATLASLARAAGMEI